MKNHQNSIRIFQEAKELMPGGVNSPARAFLAVGTDPVVIDHAAGPYLFDVDNNQYIDYVLSWGPMILGHCDPVVTRALHEAVNRGTSYGAPTNDENRLAQLVRTLVPSVEKIRLVNSGTEATMSAVRLARGFTGRDKIVKFVGNYHGHSDSLLVAAGSAAATFSVPDSPGVTQANAADTICAPYNDEAFMTRLFAQFGSQIAGVIVEPVAGNMGCVPGSLSFLTTLRQLTAEHNALLIFDEVMSGFRVAPGGAQQRLGIQPDLTTFGKIIGGGLPVGAYGGRLDLMNAIIPVGKVYQAGTLSGNPLATAAGIATLQQLLTAGQPFYDSLTEKVQRLTTGFQQAAQAARIPLKVQSAGGMFTPFFLNETDQEVTSWDSAARCNTQRFAAFFRILLENGIYPPCSQFECWFLSSLHSDELIEKTIDVAALAFKQIS
ncbi:MAG: glutamate-1-semialdehyde 2,1-aminomutase [Planctomycetia bacterium]|nr:glutamate-1-semialdehyde 2,1-aminomutase [Planctomycetia bacterium]